MTHKMKRLVSFLLTFVMIFSLIPMQVFATGNANSDEELVNMAQNIQVYSDSQAQQRPENYFASEEDLKELIEEGYEGVLFYDGTNPFSLEVDVTIPSQITMEFCGMDVVVKEDAEMIVKGNLYCEDLQVLGEMTAYKWFNCGNLDVEGIMVAEDRFSVRESVEVTGELIAKYGFHVGNGDGSELEILGNGNVRIPENGIQMQYPATLTRNTVDKIQFNSEYEGQRIDIERIFEDVEELVDYTELFSNASNYLEHDRVNYRLYTPWDDETFGSEVFEIEQDLEIPAHLEVQFNTVESVKIVNGATVTNHGEMNVFAPLTIEGELVNERLFNVQNRRKTENNAAFDGKVTLSGDGKYSGNGDFQIHVDQNVDGVEEILFGFDLDEMYFRSNTSNDGMTHYWLVKDNDGSMNTYGFKTFDKLVELADKYEGSSVILEYNGSEALVIEESFTLPNDQELELCGAELVIPANVTFKTNDWVYCGDLTVAGTMDASERVHANGDVLISGKMIAGRALSAGNRLEVTGTLDVKRDTVHMNYPAVIKGIDNIVFAEEWQSITQEAVYKDMAELKARLNEIADDYIKHDRVRYTVGAQWDAFPNGSVFVITEDITIPAHVELQLHNDKIDYVIDKNVTVTNNGYIWINRPLEIAGTLVNDKQLSVSCEETNKGKITVSNIGKMIGKGEFWVNGGKSVKDWTDVISLPNPADFDTRSHQDPDGNRSWTVTYAVNKTKLATPFNLHWGTEYREMWDWDAQNQMDVIIGFHKLARLGCMSWETDRPDQARAEIMVYRVGETKPVLECSWGFDPQRQPQYRSVDDFMRAGLPSGSYYFTVQSMADSIEYRNSDIADSRYDKDGNFNPAGIYHYVSAADQLSPAVNLKWDDRDDHVVRWATWDDNSNSPYIDGYWVEYYYSPTLNGVYEQYGGSHGRGNTESEMPFENHFLQEKGIGYYKFKVKALSSDIETIGNSEWSAFSPALEVKDISVKVSSDLNQLVNDVNNNNLKPDDIRTAVQNMDTQDLQTALLADKDNTFATQHMAQLERMAGGTAGIQVTQAASAFNPSDISIVGANLNNKAEEDESITLVVDKPEKQHVIPERYNSAVAVRFSMTLENVEDPKHLDVPVKITLPVPSSINPDFLVIMHYDVYGGHELIWPHVYEMNGKYYADFVLTSFSDFIMVERLPYQGSDDDNEPAFTKKPAAAENPLPEYVVSGQWTFADGKWTFADSNGEAYKNKWAAVVNPYAKKEAGHSEFDWFFFDENGFMMTGWVLDAGHWYYLNPVSDGTQGRMLIGWQLIDGKWYYLNTVSDGTKGAMITNTWIDGFCLDANGVWDQTKTQ